MTSIFTQARQAIDTSNAAPAVNNTGGGNAGGNASIFSQARSGTVYEAAPSTNTPTTKPSIMQQAGKAVQQIGNTGSNILSNVSSFMNLQAKALPDIAENVKEIAKGLTFRFVTPTQTAGVTQPVTGPVNGPVVQQVTQAPKIGEKLTASDLPASTLSQAPKKSVWDTLTNWFGETFGEGETGEKARAMNAYAVTTSPTTQKAIQNKFGEAGVSPQGKVSGKVLRELNKPGGNMLVNSPMEEISKELGVRNFPTNSEISNALVAVAIGTGVVTAPAATLRSLGIFSAVDAIKSKVINVLSGGKGTKASDLIPTENQSVKNTLDIIEIMGMGMATHLANEKVLGVFQDLTKDVLAKYNLPKTVMIKSQDLLSLGNKTTNNIIKTLDLNANELKMARTEATKGQDYVSIVTEDLVKLVDKPYWKQLKQKIGLSATNQKITGQDRSITSIAGMLGDGEKTPQQVMGKVFEAGMEKTPEGKNIIKNALEAQKNGQNIIVEQTKPTEKAIIQQTPEGTAKKGMETPQTTTPVKLESKAVPVTTKVNVPENTKSAIEKAAFDKLSKNPDQLVEEYRNKFGNEVSPDLGLTMLEGYKGHNASKLSRVSGAIKSVVYDNMLQSEKGQRNNTVLLTAGGPGSGKTTFVKSWENTNNQLAREQNAIVLDTTFAAQSAIDDVKKALKNDYNVDINFVSRDPIQAWTDGVLKRIGEEGRTVSEGYFLDAHINSVKNIIKAYEKYKDNPKVDFVFLKNEEYGKYPEISIDDLKKRVYNKEQLAKEISIATDKLYEQKQITKEQYEATIGDRPSTQGQGNAGEVRQRPKAEVPGQVSEVEKKYGKEFIASDGKLSAKLYSLGHAAFTGKPEALELSKDDFVKYGLAYYKTLPDYKNLQEGNKLHALHTTENDLIFYYNKATGKPLPSETVEKSQAVIDDYPIDLVTKAKFYYDKTPDKLGKPQFRRIFNEVGKFMAGDESLLPRLVTPLTNLYDLDNGQSISLLKGARFGGYASNGYIGVVDKPMVKKIYDKEIKRYMEQEVKGAKKSFPDKSMEEIKKSVQQKISEGIENKDSDIKYPTTEVVNRLFGKTKDYKGDLFIQGYLPTSGEITMVMSNGEKRVRINSKYYGYFQKLYKNPVFKTRIDTPEGVLAPPVGVIVDDKLVGVIMPLQDEKFDSLTNEVPIDKTGTELIKTKQETFKVKKSGGSSSGLASKGTETIGNYEVRTKSDEVPESFKLYKKVLELKQKYSNATIGEGYLPRGTLGVFYPDTKNVRVNGMNDIAVASHELAHFIDNKYKITRGITGKSDAKLRKDITKLYVEYYGGAKEDHPLRTRVVEGFATLIQKYIETPTTINQNYPMLVKEFLTKGGQFYNPVIQEYLKDASDIVAGYQKLNYTDKILARQTNGKSIESRSFLTKTEMIRTQVENEITPTEIIASLGGVAGTKNDPALWTYAYKAINSIIRTNIFSKDGYFAFDWDNGGFTRKYLFNWNTLINDLSKKNQLDTFGAYLIARREYFAYKEVDKLEEDIVAMKDRLAEFVTKNKEVKSGEIDRVIAKKQTELDSVIKERDDLKEILKKDQVTKEEAEGAYNEQKDKFIEEEKQFDTMVREDLDLLHNENIGLTKTKEYNKLISKEGYASMKRQFNDEITGEQSIPQTLKVGKNRISSMLSRTGSSRAIINPMASSILNHHEIVQKAVRQLVQNKIGEVVVNNQKAFGQWFQVQTTKPSIDRSGKITYPQEKDPNLLSTRTKTGKRRYFLVNSELKTLLDNTLTYENIDLFSALATGLSRQFTMGTTAFYPAFSLTNLPIDQIAAYVNSQNKFIPIFTPLNTLRKIINKNSLDYKYFKEYLDHGAERQTLWGWQRLAPDQLFEEITKETKGLRKLIKLAEKAVDIFSLPSKYSEIITRASEYIKVRKQGKPIVYALEEAGRITAPFHHIGSWKFGSRFDKSGKVTIKSIPFFNSKLQALAQLAKSINTPDGKKRFIFASLAVLAAYVSSLALLAAKGSDEQKKQYKDLYVEDLTKFIYIPNLSGKGLTRIRVAEETSIIATLITMYLGSVILDTKYSKGEYLNAGTQWLPSQLNPTDPIKMFLSWMPQWFKATAYPVLNVKDYPEVRPLESAGMSYLPAGQRSSEYTSWVAKTIGEKFNISPVKIDAFLSGVFGRSIGFATAKPNIYNFFTSIEREWYFTMGRTMNQYWDRREKADTEYNAYQGGKVNLTSDEVNKLYREKMMTDDIYELFKDYKAVNLKKEPQKASEVRDEILNQLYLMDDPNYRPKGLNNWKKDANVRRIKKLKGK